MKCRVHRIELQEDFNGIRFCRLCRHDRDAVKEQVRRGVVDSNDDPEERRSQLAEQFGATR